MIFVFILLLTQNQQPFTSITTVLMVLNTQSYIMFIQGTSTETVQGRIKIIDCIKSYVAVAMIKSN